MKPLLQQNRVDKPAGKTKKVKTPKAEKLEEKSPEKIDESKTAEDSEPKLDDSKDSEEVDK